MIGKLFSLIGRHEYILTFQSKSSCKLFGIGIKRPKLSDTFKFPMHNDELDQSNYRLNQDQGQDPDEAAMRDKKFNDVYDKVLNTTAQDIIQSEWRTSHKLQSKKMSQFMQNSTDREIMNATKAFLQNYNQKRSVEMSDLFKEKRVDDEYSDYQKYKQNYVTKQRQGYQQIDKDLFKTREHNRYNQFLTKTKLPQGKQSAQTTRYKVNKILQKLNSNYNLKQVQQQLKNVMYDQDQHSDENPIQKQEDQIENPEPITYQKTTRLSYFARQQIYIRYLQGWTVKELSLRYGILPQRVKAVVWLRHYFWQTIYPKLGDVALKLSIEAELQSENQERAYFEEQAIDPSKPRQYDSDDSDGEDQYHSGRQMIVDYGVDLQNFKAVEAGLHCINFQRTQFDYQVKPEDRYKILKVFKNSMRSQKYKIVPERFIGKKGRGYLLQRVDQFRGKSSMKPNRLFNDILLFGSNKETQHLLPDRVRKNLKKGPRMAGFIQKQKKVDKTRVP